MNKIQISLKRRYPDLHPLIFQRSLEKSKTNGELFDILETVPKEFPIVWDEKTRMWKKTDDLLQSQIFKSIK
jgi:hypothetical protein